MSLRCNYCINKTQCSECDKGWKDKFIPSKEVEHYFHRYYVGVQGIDGRIYGWDSTNPNLVSTRSITIGHTQYCPYCGEKMFPIQGYLAQGIDNYAETGKCCICQGARDEIEYKLKREELAHKHKQEMNDLEKSYKGRLQFCTEKLIDIQLKEIIKGCESPHEYSYFSDINDAKQLMDI